MRRHLIEKQHNFSRNALIIYMLTSQRTNPIKFRHDETANTQKKKKPLDTDADWFQYTK